MLKILGKEVHFIIFWEIWINMLKEEEIMSAAAIEEKQAEENAKF